MAAASTKTGPSRDCRRNRRRRHRRADFRGGRRTTPAAGHQAFRIGPVRGVRRWTDADPPRAAAAVQPRSGGTARQPRRLCRLADGRAGARGVRGPAGAGTDDRPSGGRTGDRRRYRRPCARIWRWNTPPITTTSRHEAIRLSGQFHLLLAQIAGNAVMLRMMKELVTRTSLIIGIFGAAGRGQLPRRRSCRHRRCLPQRRCPKGRGDDAGTPDPYRKASRS